MNEVPPHNDDAASMRLDNALKLFGLVGSGGQAKQLIQAGAVRVNGVVETRRKHRLRHGDTVQIGDEGFVMEFTQNP